MQTQPVSAPSSFFSDHWVCRLGSAGREASRRSSYLEAASYLLVLATDCFVVGLAGSC